MISALYAYLCFKLKTGIVCKYFLFILFGISFAKKQYHQRHHSHINVVEKMKKIKSQFYFIVAVFLVSGNFIFQGGFASEYDLTSLSIEDLMNIQVSLDTRQDKSIADAAAAIYVITKEDIESMGCHSIMDLLRMVPGMHVGNLNNNIFAITARGLNSYASNKLQVLIDGRSIYTPIFSGVVWDAIDLVLDDIEQIEVIRGPGATLWGSNAVNGIINIKTKNAFDTKGFYVKAGMGNEIKSLVETRFGQQRSPKLSYRIYGKYFTKDAALFKDGTDADDDWILYRTGFRMDYLASTRNVITVHGNIYQGEAGQTAQVVNEDNEHFFPVNNIAKLNGAHLLANWDHTISDRSEYSLKLYWDYQSRDEPILFNGFFHQFDADFQHAIRLQNIHQFIYGFNYHGQYSKSNDAYYIKFDPVSRYDHIYSAFFQDEISLAKNKFRMIMGSKFEHNKYTGLEIQPSFRMIYKPNANIAFWCAQSRAVRTPARVELDMFVENIVLSDFNSPISQGMNLQFSQSSVVNGQSEVLNSTEAGVRFRLAQNINFDIAGYYHDYDQIRSSNINRIEYGIVNNAPFVRIQNVLNNNVRIWSKGIELAVDYKPFKSWMIRGGYSYIDLSGSLINKNLTGAFFGDPNQKNPNHQATLLNHITFSKWFDLAMFGRYVDNIQRYGVKSYYELDIQIKSQLNKHFDLIFLGKNLLHGNHQEFNEDNLPMISTYMQRSIWGGIAIQY